jgi:hypothetical protein
LVEDVDTKAVGDAASIVNDQLSGEVVLKKGDVAVAAGCGQQGALNLTACQVGCMNDAAVGVAALTGEMQGAICSRR